MIQEREKKVYKKEDKHNIIMWSKSERTEKLKAEYNTIQV